MRRVKLSVIVGTLGMLLSACSILPNNPPLETYRLAPSQVQVQVRPSKLSLSIPEPYANRVIAHQRLAVITDNNEVLAYDGVRWEDVAHKVFRNRLVEDFQRANSYKTILINDEQINVDRSLRLDVQAYQLQYKQGRPSVVIAVNATLVNRRTGDVIASRHFHAEQETDSAQLSAILPVFSQLNDQVNTALIQWTRGQDK
ncbi:ABC-type transport auxiliary lipoprotein family protein [Pelistega suis]|uniref:ABC-type transport auxiliary lipoprotein component domain-containing protein n=1 Tax=Pelistega suis TaxID=1631957 RepID=A0A849P684_9BURK|nr:ABC-type transport auxiliary lipoprotein family protein [Pelistega suis]NOL51255.1 hypothetical protein [Pelistega suis]